MSTFWLAVALKFQKYSWYKNSNSMTNRVTISFLFDSTRMPMGNGHMVRGVPGDRAAHGPHARSLPKRRSFNEAQLQGGIHWEQDMPTDRQPHMANGRVAQVG